MLLVVLLNGSPGATAPSEIAGVTSPNPVTYNAMVSPSFAGFFGVTTEKSGCSAATYPTPPVGLVNAPGAVVFTNIVTTFDTLPLLIAWICAIDSVVPNGTNTEICVGLTT